MSARRALLTDAATSSRLGRVRQRGTAPELEVRALLSEAGLRTGQTTRRLPGSPDLVNLRRGWCVFVHGCFWHGHLGCPKATVPARNRKFWEDKLAANKARDARSVRALRKTGFVVVVVWQCEVEQHPARVQRRFERLLGGLEAQR